MTKTQAVFYRDRQGQEPVDAFIDSLDRAAAQVAIDNAIDLLNGLSPSAPPLAFPHSSQLAGELRELRAHYGRTHYRILYQRSGNLFILLHAHRQAQRRSPQRRHPYRPGALSGLQGPHVQTSPGSATSGG